MKICYTVCTLNRLGQIIVLANSVLKYNPEYKFIACLADEIDGRINVEQYENIEFISFSSLPFDKKQELSDKYDIFELSCVLKSFFGNHLMNQYQPDVLLYLDTDICVYNSLDVIEKELILHSILITPHFTSPPPTDGKFPLERDVLNSGLYNGGFVCLKNDEYSKSFLKWWEDRLFSQGYNNVCEGMMVDQLWLDLVPIYFKQTKILDHAGCNFAYWNMHERKLEFENDKYSINGIPLIFFHFSGYRINEPERLSLHQNRIDEADYPSLKRIIAQYHNLLIQSEFERYSALPPYYGRKGNKKKTFLIKKVTIGLLAKFGYALEKIKKI